VLERIPHQWFMSPLYFLVLFCTYFKEAPGELTAIKLRKRRADGRRAGKNFSRKAAQKTRFFGHLITKVYQTVPKYTKPYRFLKTRFGGVWYSLVITTSKNAEKRGRWMNHERFDDRWPVREDRGASMAYHFQVKPYRKVPFRGWAFLDQPSVRTCHMADQMVEL
jgi:hypothetical protein